MIRIKKWKDYVKHVKQQQKTGYIAINIWVSEDEDGHIIILEIVYFSEVAAYASSYHGVHWKNEEGLGTSIDSFDITNIPYRTIKTFPAPWLSLTNLADEA